MTLSLSVAACFLWGIADFIGGVKSRQLSTVTVIFVSSLFSIATLSVMLVLHPEQAPDLSSSVWAVAAGVVGIFSMYFLYRGLSMGMMSVVAPIAATGVVIPVFAGILRGDPLSALQALGILAAVAGVIFVSIGKKLVKSRPELVKALKYAFLAAIFSGLYLIFVAKTGDRTPLWSIFILRMTYILVLLPLIVVKKNSLSLCRSQLAILAGMGFIDTFAGLAFVVATGIGLLSVVSVISSLYPAVTVLLSVGFLRERLSLHQLTGVALSFGGIILLSV